MFRFAVVSLALVAVLAVGVSAATPGGSAPKAAGGTQWVNGPSTDPSYFPIGVWLQDPGRAAEYKALGVNFYVGLWNGPTEQQLAQLKAAGMNVICTLNDVGMRHVNDKNIIAWMHGDEPDNCQPLEGYWKNDLAAIKKAWPDMADYTAERWASTFGTNGAPVPPAWIEKDYNEISRKDPTRPVYLNLGVGVAYDSLAGRGIRSQHPEDYYGYCKGCDIVSYDVYPERQRGDRRGKLWHVPKGVVRLRKYCGDEKIVWNIIEGSRSSATGNKPTAESLRSEAWMSIIHGSRGIIYFVHLFQPAFVEAGVMGDAELMQGYKSLHAEIRSLAPAINSPNVEGTVTVTSSVPGSSDLTAEGLEPVATMVKKQGGALYIFSVRMEGTPATGTFKVQGLPASARAQVLGENRTVPVNGGTFTDEFGAYQVHLYKINL